jgi:hypothetical protein
VIVAATPISPPDGDRCWAFHVVNDEGEAFDSIVVEKVSYEWGDSGNSEALNRTFGRLAPGASVEVYRETDTEVRTALTMRVRVAGRVRCIYAEVGRLYATPRGLVDIPILGVQGKLAEIEELA